MTNHPNPESDFTARPSCPDPIECGHEAALGQAREQVRRLGLMVDEYGAGASALTDKLWRVRDLHRKTCLVARSDVPPTSFTCGLCEVLDAPAVSVPPPAPRADDQAALRDRIADALARLDAEKWGVEIPAKDHPFWQMYPTQADAVLAVLPEPADQAAVLREAADDLWALANRLTERGQGVLWAAEWLRRRAGAPQPVGPCVAGEQQNETPEAETGCAHCGKTIRLITGTLAEWWVHDPGGHTICVPEQAASSPRATPKPAAGKRQDGAQP